MNPAFAELMDMSVFFGIFASDVCTYTFGHSPAPTHLIRNEFKALTLIF